MSSIVLRLLTLVFLTFTVAACEAIGTIFEAGVWMGALLVVLILGVVGFIASKIRR
jgi:hypothetical protein